MKMMEIISDGDVLLACIAAIKAQSISQVVSFRYIKLDIS
jgi:hypothetical protein